MNRKRDSFDAAAVRNLEEIREEDPSTRPSRLGALVLASLGGAAIVFAAVLLMRTPPKLKPVGVDPLGDLVAKAYPAGVSAAPQKEGLGENLTFPGMLSDSKSPTTALEAVRNGTGKPASSPEKEAAFQASVSAADRLAPIPMPAQHVLSSPAAENSPRDTLTTMARQVSRETGEESPVGGPGGYQLQVSSFKTQEEGDKFAAALRRRGHRAYVEPAQVKGRGLWYRVRIGPFKYRHSAVIYRQEFEAKERLVTFIVDPPKTVVRVHDSGDEHED